MHITTTLTTMVALATVLMAPLTSAHAAEEVKVGAETKQFCSWTGAAAHVRRLGFLEGGITEPVTFRKLGKDNAFAQECASKRAAKRAAAKADAVDKAN